MPRIRPKLPWALPNRLWRDRQGASLLEFTVVLPFLLAFGLGVLEFGNLLYQYHQVTTGVRDAARYLASAGYVDADGDNSADPGELDPDGTRRSNATRIAICGEITSCTTNGDKRVDWWPADISTIATALDVQYCIGATPEGDTIAGCDCPNPAINPDPGFGANKVCVSTTATYDDLGFLAYFGLGPITFTTGHEQRYYGIR